MHMHVHAIYSLPTCTRACLRTAECSPELPPSQPGRGLPALALPEHHIMVSFRPQQQGKKRNYPSLHFMLRPARKVNRDKEVKAAAFASAIMCWLTSGSQAATNWLMMAPCAGSEPTCILLTLTLRSPSSTRGPGRADSAGWAAAAVQDSPRRSRRTSCSTVRGKAPPC